MKVYEEIVQGEERTYDEGVVNVLIYLWKMPDYLCDERLVVYIREIIPVLNRLSKFKIDEKAKEKLMKISPATIDKPLKSEKRSSH